MVAITDESFHKEHLLAKKVQDILEHQQQQQLLRMQKEKLQQKNQRLKNSSFPMKSPYNSETE